MRAIDADMVPLYLIGEGQDHADRYGFKPGDIIRFRPSEVDAILRKMPTVELERKTGKWLPDNNNYYEERFICSVCGRSYKVDTCMGKPMWDFCPCGAKMEGVES